MQLNPSAIGGQFVLPNQPRMTTIAGTPDPFSFKAVSYTHLTLPTSDLV